MPFEPIRQLVFPLIFALKGKPIPVAAGLLATLLGLMTVLPTRAQQTLLFYEPFSTNYGDGTLLGAGATATNWSQGNSTQAATSAVVTNAGMLSYNGLATSSGYGLRASTGVSRNRGAVFASQTNGATYASFLLDVQTAPGATKGLVYLRTGTNAGTPTFAVFLNHSNQLQISKRSGSPTSAATAALNVGEPHLVVMRYTLTNGSANDEIALWLDPTNSTFGLSEASVPDAALKTTSGSDDPSVDSFFIAGLVSDASIQYLDEIRIGTTWAAVTPTGNGGGGGGPAFRITGSQLVSNQLTLTGIGGTNSGGLTVLTSTNVTNTIASWSPWTNGTFDTSGNFSVTAPVNPGDAQSFYRISQP